MHPEIFEHSLRRCDRQVDYSNFLCILQLIFSINVFNNVISIVGRKLYVSTPVDSELCQQRLLNICKYSYAK